MLNIFINSNSIKKILIKIELKNNIKMNIIKYKYLYSDVTSQ